MFLTKQRKAVLSACVGLTMALCATAAQAVTLDFFRITNNSPLDAAAQFSLDVVDNADSTAAYFTFSVVNGTNPGASIAEIYFDDGSPLLFTPPPSVIASVGTVGFTEDGSATPGNLPGGNTLADPFVASALLKAEATKTDTGSQNDNRISVGESLTLGLTYQVGVDFDDVLLALANGDLRVGIHVQSLLDGASDGFVNNGLVDSNVPLPAAGWLMIAGLGGLGVMRRRRKAI